MTKTKNYFILLASVFAFSAVFALAGMRDVKAETTDDSLSSLIKRIEALESRPANNVSAGMGKIRGLDISLDIRHRFEIRDQMIADGAAVSETSPSTNAFGLGTVSFDEDTGLLTRGAGTGTIHDSSNTNVGRFETQEFTLQWVHLGFNADVNRNVRAYVELQDVRTFGDETTTTGRLSRTDVQEGYVELRNLGDINSILNNMELRVGRWRAAYGNHRLIGSLPWANQTRAYDGARLRWDNKKGHWADLFAFQINEKETGVASGSPTTSGGEDREEVLYGLYTHFKVSDGIVAEPYVFARARSAEDTQSPTATTGKTGKTGEQRYTLGFRFDGRNIPALPGADFTIEPAWQFGKVEGLRGTTGAGVEDFNNYSPSSNGSNISNSIQAFAIYAGVGYTFQDIPWTPRIGYAFSFASGDDRPNQGSAKTFDHLYPTGHGHNGYMDLTAWQNIEDHQIHLSAQPTKKLSLDLKVHFFSMNEEADALYNVGGGTGWGGPIGFTRAGSDLFTRAGVTSSVDDTLGQEIDLTVKYKLFDNFGVVAGYSHFFADDWIKDTGGGVDRGIDWAYIQTTMKF